MQQGPIYKTEQVKKFNIQELSEEDMEEVTGQEEIWKMHKEWAEKHFKSSEAKTIPNSKKVIIKLEETEKAMNMIARGKAVSKDRIMDLIFDRTEYPNIKMNGIKLDEEELKCK